MDTLLLVLVSVLVGGFALGFYMDWFGLWVSEEDLRGEIDRAKERMERSGTEGGNKAPEAGAKAKQETGTETSCTSR
jgi:hypothetical protein